MATNPTATIWVVHERQGGDIKRGFTVEADARNWFHHEVAEGRLSEQWYTVSPVTLENMSAIKWSK